MLSQMSGMPQDGHTNAQEKSCHVHQPSNLIVEQNAKKESSTTPIHAWGQKCQELLENLARLRKTRKKVSGLRLSLNEMRNALKLEREDLSTRDAQLFQRIRLLFDDKKISELDSLFDMFEGLRESRSRLQLQENDYLLTEDQLICAEWELAEAESSLYERNLSAQISAQGNDELADFQADTKNTYSTFSTQDGLADMSPQFDRYVSRRGDYCLVEERLEGIRAERAHWIEEELGRAQIGRGFDERSKTFLREFDAHHKQLQQDLVDVEEDIRKLKKAIDAKDKAFVTQFNQTIGDLAMAPTWDIAECSEDDLTPAGLETHEFDPLLYREDDRRPPFPNSFFEPDGPTVSPVNYINQWLLHKLRISTHEVSLFKFTGDFGRLGLTSLQIQEVALDWWFKDDSGADFAAA